MAFKLFSLRVPVLCQVAFAILVLLSKDAKSNVVFQPNFLVASGPRVSAFLLGNTTGMSLTLSTISPSNATGRLPPPSCIQKAQTQWVLSQEIMSKTTLRVQLRLNRSLELCGNNETEDCCPEPLCVLETLCVSACLGNTPQASILIQAKVYSQVLPSSPASDNKTVISNQAYQPLGPCPCDLSEEACDVQCCCDQDCSPEVLRLFDTQCLPGPFGGNVTPIPDYNCSVQSSENSPDWFPFLCVTSSADNSPFLGLFYQGHTITPKPSPSFQSPELLTPVPINDYRQGVPIFTTSNQYFTIPQNSMLGQCIDIAPVAFLENFQTQCVTHLLSCPTAPTELRVNVRDGLGGVVTVNVTDEMAIDLSPFVSSPTQWVSLDPEVTPEPQLAAKRLCENVTLALDYTLFWRGNGLISITVTRTIGSFTLDPNVSLTTRFSAVFVNGNATAQPNSGNPGYLVGRPVIGGIVDPATQTIQRASISLWQPAGDGLCASAGLRPVMFGVNSTSGCMLRLTLHDLTQCSQLRDTVQRVLATLVNVTLTARNGKPDFGKQADWINISHKTPNSSQPSDYFIGVCVDVPSHLHIHIRSAVFGTVGGVPQKEIKAVEVSYRVSTWRVECEGGGGPTPCLNPNVAQSFLVTSSVTFSDTLVYTGPPKTRFQINFTEFDCDRNDICWPELAFPLTSYYTGEPHSQALAKGLILVFFFIAASVLGTPWRQIRQAWSSTSL